MVQPDQAESSATPPAEEEYSPLAELGLPPQRRGIARRLLRFFGIATLVAYFGFAAVVLALRFWILPQIEDHPEAVAEVIPRIAAPLASPLFVATIALTLLLVWAAIRNRFHARGFLVSAVIVLMLTSFRPMTNIEKPSVGDVVAPESQEPQPFEQPDPDPPQPPDPPYVPEMRTYQYTFDTHDLPERLQQMGLPPEVSVEITMPERMRLDREMLRASLRDLRIRIREEERRQHRHRRYYPD